MSDVTALHSVESEQSVLGGLLRDPQAFDRIAGVVAEGDFSSRDHRAIFRAISKLFDAGKPVDVITVAEFLDSHKMLESAGGLPYLGTLAQNVPSAANIARYAEIVRERSVLRRLVAATDDVREQIDNRNGRSARELLDYAETKIAAVAESSARKDDGFQAAADLVDAELARIDEQSVHQSEITGLQTGFIDLDKLTTGLQPGELVIVAARPSIGKTAFALNIAEHVSTRLGKAAGVFSMEMINGQLMMRMLSSVSRLNAQRVKVGRLNDGEWAELSRAAEVVRDSRLYLNDAGGLTVTEVRAQARRLNRECGGLSLLVLDYLQQMNGSGHEDNRTQELEKISRGLKQLAKELHIPIIALSQLNRSLEQRPNKRPIMSDLRESGAIEQDADLILFLYRDEYYNQESTDRGIAEVIIGKQRNGPTGTVFLNFTGHNFRFDNRAHAPIPSHLERDERRARRAARSGGFSAQKNGYGGHDDIEM